MAQMVNARGLLEVGSVGGQGSVMELRCNLISLTRRVVHYSITYVSPKVRILRVIFYGV